MKRDSAFSLTELLVVIAILTIVSGILVGIFIGGFRIFNQQSAAIETQSQAKLVTSTITRDVQQANKVIQSRTFGFYLFTSSSDTLILELPSIDNSQNIIQGKFDYEVFYLDPANPQKLKLKREVALESSRRSETKTIANLIENLTFVYKKGSIEVLPSDSEIITIKVTNSRTSYGKLYSTSLTGQAKLRNK